MAPAFMILNLPLRFLLKRFERVFALLLFQGGTGFRLILVRHFHALATNPALLVLLVCSFMASVAFSTAAEAGDDSVILAAAAAGKPIIIARVLGSKLVAQGTRSQQLDYRIKVIQTLSGQREPWLNSVAHYSSDSLQTRRWRGGWLYVFVFDRSDATMPLYAEPLSRFGNRKAQIIRLIESQKRDASAQPSS